MKKAPSNVRSFFFRCFVKESVFEFLDFGFLTTQTAKVVDA